MPALQIIAVAGDRQHGIRSRDLIRLLRERVEPRAGDLQILAGRKDDRLSQVIRNLISHKSLARAGLATYRKDARTGEWWINLTELGWASVSPNHNPTYR